ncbi:YcjF family protein [Vibrio sp. MA40-2]|uniref:YcjF family protein n=1 Tax=Vibrio sp. MA40-2 TaxID=3391828 RepID=UPI0039A52447
MTEYKTKQVFSHDLRDDALDKQNREKNTLDQTETEEIELTAKATFEQQVAFIPTTAEQDQLSDSVESQLEDVIRPKAKKRWLISTTVIAFSGLIAWQTIDSVYSAIQSSDWLVIGWTVFVAGLAGLGITAIGRELLKLRRLRQHFSIHEQSESLLHSSGFGQGKSFCQKLAEQAGVSDENPNFVRWEKAINETHNDAEVLHMYEGMVVAQQDEQAKKIVAKLSTEAAVLVAVSPLALADILLVAWRNFKLIDQLAEIYGVELGYWSRIQLFKLVLTNMAAAGASEVATDASIDLLSMDLAGKVSTRVAQGFGVGILTARLGIRAMALLRPIPWNQENKVRLGEIRKLLLNKLKKTL